MPGLMKKINFHSTFELNQNSLKNYYMNVSMYLFSFGNSNHMLRVNVSDAPLFGDKK